MLAALGVPMADVPAWGPLAVLTGFAAAALAMVIVRLVARGGGLRGDPVHERRSRGPPPTEPEAVARWRAELTPRQRRRADPRLGPRQLDGVLVDVRGRLAHIRRDAYLDEANLTHLGMVGAHAVHARLHHPYLPAEHLLLFESAGTRAAPVIADPATANHVPGPVPPMGDGGDPALRAHNQALRWTSQALRRRVLQSHRRIAVEAFAGIAARRYDQRSDLVTVLAFAHGSHSDAGQRLGLQR